MPSRPPRLDQPRQPRRDDAYRAGDPDRRFVQSRFWREKLRPRQLRDQPLCEHCKALGKLVPAEEIDHIVRPRGDRDLQRDPRNLQSLCKGHHLTKSAWERRNDGKPLRVGVAVSGWPIELPGGGSVRR